MASQWLLLSSLQRFSGSHCQHCGADLKSCWLLQGQYNDQAWDALDFIISEAGNRGLRLVIAIADNWETDSNTDNKCALPSTLWIMHDLPRLNLLHGHTSARHHRG